MTPPTTEKDGEKHGVGFNVGGVRITWYEGKKLTRKDISLLFRAFKEESLIEKPAEKCNQELEIEHALYAYCVLPKGHAGIHDPNIPAPKEESSGWESEALKIANEYAQDGAIIPLRDSILALLARQREEIAGAILAKKFPAIPSAPGEMESVLYPTAKPVHESTDVFMQHATNEALDLAASIARTIK